MAVWCSIRIPNAFERKPGFLLLSGCMADVVLVIADRNCINMSKNTQETISVRGQAVNTIR